MLNFLIPIYFYYEVTSNNFFKLISIKNIWSHTIFRKIIDRHYPFFWFSGFMFG